MSNEELTKIHVTLRNHPMSGGESMWAKSLGDDTYRIENIPFCAYGLNYGDVVFAVSDEPDLKPEIRKVMHPSGNATIRVIFLGMSSKDQTPIIERIILAGGEVERATESFLCINIPNVDIRRSVVEILGELEQDDILSFETCEARVEGSFDDMPRDDEEEPDTP